LIDIHIWALYAKSIWQIWIVPNTKLSGWYECLEQFPVTP